MEVYLKLPILQIQKGKNNKKKHHCTYHSNNNNFVKKTYSQFKIISKQIEGKQFILLVQVYLPIQMTPILLPVWIHVS